MENTDNIADSRSNECSHNRERVMSYYRVCKIAMGQDDFINHRPFDNREDAEHYAKNQSSSDNEHRYEVQKNNEGEFSTIKTYLKGQDTSN